MAWRDLITSLKLLFSKDKELYVFIHATTGYYPRDIELYRLAFVHRSKSVLLDDGHWANNERLEFLGDAVVDTVVAHHLYTIYPDKNEGFLTATRAKIVQRESLNRIGYLLHLDSHMRTALHSASHNSYVCGNAVEALVGALYLDRGYEACRHFIIDRVIKRHFDLSELEHVEQNFKSRLIEWTQKYRVNIEFELVDSFVDETNNPVFRTAILLGGIFAADDIGYSKKESHQGASHKVLQRLERDAAFRQQVLSTVAPEFKN